MQKSTNGASRERSSEDQFIKGIKGVAPVLVLLVGITGAHFSTKHDIEGRIKNNETGWRFTEREFTGRMDSLSNKVAGLRAALDQHVNSGPDGLPHPKGWGPVIEALRRRVDVMQSDLQRLRKQSK